MIPLILLAVGGSMLLSLVLTLLGRHWAWRIGFVDRPDDGHKRHDRPVALGGGIALFWAVTVPLLMGILLVSWWEGRSLPEWVPQLVRTHLPGVVSKRGDVLGLLACALCLHGVGLLDDRRSLGAGVKLMVQLIVSLVVAGPMGIRLAEALPAPLPLVLTVLWMLTIINAFNFLDNMDGLSAGVGAIAAGVFALSAAGAGQVFVPVLAWIVVGALLGFLVFNFAPATVFMGDAGSLVVGFWMAVLTILTTYYDPGRGLSPLGLLVPVVVLAVPLYDVGSVVIHRLRLGESPLKGDRRHFSHRLVRRGMGTRTAVLTIYLATAATALPAVVLPRLDWLHALPVLLSCLSVVALIALLEHAGGSAADPSEHKTR